MEKEKNMMKTVYYYLKVNIIKEKNGTEKDIKIIKLYMK